MINMRPKSNPQAPDATLYRGYPIMRRYITRFRRKYRIDPDSGCWNWVGSVNSGGIPTYGIGKHGLDQKNLVIAAYKFSFVLEYGNEWSNFAIKRTCGNKLCVKPGHFYVERALSVPYSDLRDCRGKGCGKTIPIGNNNAMCLSCTIQQWVEKDQSASNC